MKSRAFRRVACCVAALTVLLVALAYVATFSDEAHSKNVKHDSTNSLKKNQLTECIERIASGALSFRVPKVEPKALCLMFHHAQANATASLTTVPVPKIIHQSWKRTAIPRHFKVWSESWKRLHPSWDYWFWTDADNRELVQTYYPEYLDMYNSLWVEINRADFVRALYMHRYGGVYADLDTWCLRPMDDLVRDSKAYVAEMSEETWFNQNVPNAWFASRPGHPFWVFFAQVVKEYVGLLQRDYEIAQAEQIAGPMILKQSLDAWNDIHNSDPTVEIIKAGKIYVDDWHEYQGPEERLRFYSKCPKEKIHQGTIGQRCQDAYPDAYALTFWTHSWNR